MSFLLQYVQILLTLNNMELCNSEVPLTSRNPTPFCECTLRCHLLDRRSDLLPENWTNKGWRDLTGEVPKERTEL